MVIEGDRSRGDVEGESAMGAVVVLPSRMGEAEEVVGDGLDRLGERHGSAFDHLA